MSTLTTNLPQQHHHRRPHVISNPHPNNGSATKKQPPLTYIYTNIVEILINIFFKFNLHNYTVHPRYVGGFFERSPPSINEAYIRFVDCESGYNWLGLQSTHAQCKHKIKPLKNILENKQNQINPFHRLLQPHPGHKTRITHMLIRTYIYALNNLLDAENFLDEWL